MQVAAAAKREKKKAVISYSSIHVPFQLTNIPDGNAKSNLSTK
jgi:hypothetical protein